MSQYHINLLCQCEYQQGHFVVEGQNLEELQVCGEDDQAQVVAVVLVDERNLLQLHVAVAECSAEYLKDSVCQNLLWAHKAIQCLQIYCEINNISFNGRRKYSID